MSQTNIYPVSSALFAPSNTVANYTNLWNGTAGWQMGASVAGLYTVGNVVGCGGTITFTGWRVKVQAAPGAGASMSFTVQQNGTSIGMSVTISGAAQTTAVWSGSVTFNPGDIITVVSQPSGSPTVAGSKYVNWTLKWTSTTTACQICTAYNGNNSIATAGDIQLGPQWGGGHAWVAGDDTGEQSPVPVPGTFQNLYVYLSADPTTGGVHPGETLTVTIYKNPLSGGVNTGRSATTITVAAGVSGVSTDLTHSVHFAAGDMISIRATSSTNCAAEQISIGMDFVPDTPGYSIVMGEDIAGNNVSNYHWLIGSSATPTETIAQIPMFACTLLNLYARASTSSGTYVNIPSGQNLTMNGRKNALASGSPGNMQVVITNSQYGSDTTNQITYADGDLLNLFTTTTSSAGSTSLARWGAALFVPQPDTIVPIYMDFSLQPYPERREVVSY